MDEYIVVLSTINKKEDGVKIANAIVGDRIAACVNIIPGVTSIYEWEDKLCTEDEFILIIKSRASKYNEIRQKIEDLHPYDLPEIISLPIKSGNEPYLSWIKKNTDS